MLSLVLARLVTLLRRSGTGARQPRLPQVYDSNNFKIAF